MKIVLLRNSVVLLVLFSLFSACKGGESASLNLSKDNFKAGEMITVIYTAPSNLDTNAWVGIIPSNIPHGSEAVNDQHDLTYKYLNKSTSGNLTFAAPSPGSYDFRMHNTDSNGVEIASITFTVEGPAQPVNPPVKATLLLPKNSFSPGEQIRVNFTAPPSFATNAWVGIIPSNIAHGSESVNDQHDVSYQYLRKQTSGQLLFSAPGQAGSYDFRMHDTDSNGVEVSSITFTVK